MTFFENRQQEIEELEKLIEMVAEIALESQKKVFWLSVDLRTFIASTGVKHTEVEHAVLYLVERILETINGKSPQSPSKTLLVSTFNFSFPQTKVFDLANTPVQTGAFGSLLLKHYPGHRMVQPFYSFLVFGASQDCLTQSDFIAGTGPDSVFEWVVEQQTQLICLGHHYVKSLSSIHHAEHCAQIEYRYVKRFRGTAILLDRQRDIETEFYVRELGCCDFSSLTLDGDKVFREQGVVQNHFIDNLRRPILCQTINHLPAHQLMLSSLLAKTNPLVDYIGPEHPSNSVITAKVADQLYQQELKRRKAS